MDQNICKWSGGIPLHGNEYVDNRWVVAIIISGVFCWVIVIVVLQLGGCHWRVRWLSVCKVAVSVWLGDCYCGTGTGRLSLAGKVAVRV